MTINPVPRDDQIFLVTQVLAATFEAPAQCVFVDLVADGLPQVVRLGCHANDLTALIDQLQMVRVELLRLTPVRH